MHDELKMVFFGTPTIAVSILEKLNEEDITPTLIVTSPDKKTGRGQVLTPPPVKQWALENNIAILQTQSITPEIITELQRTDWDVFIVAAYGKLLPKKVLDIPTHGTLNVHPSLLPKLRGPSPIRGAILADERQTGVSIMLLDEQMDHGPILAQASVELEEWPPSATLLESLLGDVGGALLAETLPDWLNGLIAPAPQEHSKATFSKKIKKEDAHIDLSSDPYTNLLKINAYEGSPGAYTFIERNGKEVRIKIHSAHLAKDGSLVLDRITPEGRKEMSYTDFMRG